MNILTRQIQCLIIFSISVFLGSMPAFAGNFLPPEQAFAFSSKQDATSLQVHWKIEHGYYLYKERIFAYIEKTPENVDLPVIFSSQSELKLDKNFGEVAVFFSEASAVISINDVVKNNKAQKITIEYQGCAKDGLCYQPLTKEITLDVTTAKELSTNVSITTASTQSSKSTNDMTTTAGITKFLKHAGLLSTIGIFFLLGVGLSLTPCILPMIPILSSIIVGHGEKLTARHGIALSSAYVLGMAISYALAGILAATFGAQGNLQMYMQNPWVISIFSGVFVVLALSMFGLYTLALPTRLQNALYNLSNKQSGGHLTGVFVMGALSALVVSPCVSAPLAGALVFISSTGDKLLGGLALFALGIGMGLPLIAIGAGGGKLVPKAGLWMNQVKTFFGVILLAVAIWLISRIIDGQISLLLWSLLLIFYGIHSGALEPVAIGTARLGKAASFILVFYGCILMLGTLTGGTNPLQPIKLPTLANQPATANNSLTTLKADDHSEQSSLFTRVKTLQELQDSIVSAKSKHKEVLIDFYADWCTSCIEMEHNVFNQPNVQEALKDYALIQVDVTKNTLDDQTILNQFGLYGPPSILFFGADGIELADKRLQGEMPANEFIQHVSNNCC